MYEVRLSSARQNLKQTSMNGFGEKNLVHLSLKLGRKDMKMRFSIRTTYVVLLASLVLLASSGRSVSTAKPILPNPVLNFLGQEPFSKNGKDFIRYNYEVSNRDEYPNDLFESSPNLPPCGANTKASRTWLDIFDQRGKRLNGFCAFGKSSDLNGFWFALESDVVPPSYVYIELNDRKTNTKYKSNLADTTL